MKEPLTALLKPNTKELSQSTAKAHICLTLRLEPLAKPNIQYSPEQPVILVIITTPVTPSSLQKQHSLLRIEILKFVCTATGLAPV